MTLLAVGEREVDAGPLARADPLATVGTAFLAGVLVALADDPVTTGTALALEVVAVRAGGVPLGLLARRGWPLLVSALGIGLTTVLLAPPPDPWRPALGAVLRVLAVALPGVAVLLTVDPTRLADSLVWRARVPAQLAYGTLAALRLLPLLAAEWQTLALARRARGLDRGGPLTAVRRLGGQVLALLVAAVRRGSRLATAMEARGFDTRAPRTLARPLAATRAQLVVAAAGPVLVAVAVAVSAAAGTLRWVWS